MMIYNDFFDLIDSSGNQPIAALFMTYGFDAELFEHHVLPTFLGIVDDPNENELRYRYQIALKLKEVPVAVISDAKQYNGGRTFLYDNIAVTTEVFHPKFYILLFKDFMRVIISSGNLTKSGLCYNAELLWYEDIYLNESNTLSREIIDIVSFMEERYNLSNIDAIKEIKKYLLGSLYNEGYPKIISTCFEQSIFSNVIHEIKGVKSNCKALTIMSPFFENDREKALDRSLIMSFVNQIKGEYPKIKINLYFPAVYDKDSDKYLVNVPENIFKELIGKYSDIGFYAIPKEWEQNGELVLRIFHAKLIYAEFANGYSLYLSGSVNFTNNAMMSNSTNLRNTEIGVINYTKNKLVLPQCAKVPYNKLLVLEKKELDDIITCFIDSAIYNGTDLIIYINKSKAVIPFEINYNNRKIRTVHEKVEQVIIERFSLKKQQDLKIICGEFSFYVPILIPNKEDIVTEDLKLSFEIGMKDIIDYLAGRYKSMSELKRMKGIINGADPFKDNSITIFFRQNLQRFYKALDTLKSGLEKPFYSEYAFNNYINEPIGLNNLITLILKDYKENKQKGIDVNDVETFLFLIQICYIVEHLSFQEDWLNEDVKRDILKTVMTEPKEIIKAITEYATGNVKKQYQILLNEYGLVV